MIYKLDNENKARVLPLIQNTLHELMVTCVARGTSPGEVYADSEDDPKSCLIKTAECNVIAGNARNDVFTSEIKSHIDYWDQLTCDTEDWKDVIGEIHPNTGLRKYKRIYYELDAEAGKNFNPGIAGVQLVYTNYLSELTCENKNIVTEWNAISSVKEYTNLCLVAIMVCNNKISACAGVDCIVDNKVEIGIMTLKEFRGRGYGYASVTALVNELIRNGIKKIGWHCVSTNKGSRRIAEKCGFTFIREYESYTPYPPIENKHDLTMKEWIEYARFFQEKGSTDINQYWQAARCWAFAEDMASTLACIEKLAEKEVWWFVDYLSENEEFQVFASDAEWLKAVEGFRNPNV